MIKKVTLKSILEYSSLPYHTILEQGNAQFGSFKRPGSFAGIVEYCG